MELVTNNSEAAFINSISVVSEHPEKWMYVHIRLASFHAAMCLREGISIKSLEKFRAISLRLAERLPFNELNNNNKIFVFEDGDILAILSKESSHLDAMIQRLKTDFVHTEFSRFLEIHNMEDKIAGLVSLQKEKEKHAAEYRETRIAIQAADDILKIVKPDPKRAAAVQAKKTNRTETYILIIEDDMLARGLIDASLKNDYTIIHAKNAQEGIAAFIQYAPDVVFLDIHLPDLDGREVLRRLICIDPRAYVVMLSADSVRDNILISHEGGAAGFIKKPFTKERLQEYIRKCPTISSEGKAALKAEADMNAKVSALGWGHAMAFTKKSG